MPNEKCGGKDMPPDSQGDTPYGHWVCVDGKPVWYAEAGIVTPPEEEIE